MQAERGPLQREAEEREGQLARLQEAVEARQREVERLRHLHEAEGRQLATPRLQAPSATTLSPEDSNKPGGQPIMSPSQPAQALLVPAQLQHGKGEQERGQDPRLLVQDPHLLVQEPLAATQGREHEYQPPVQRMGQKLSELREAAARQLSVAGEAAGRWLAAVARSVGKRASVGAVEGGRFLRRGLAEAREVANAAAMAAIKGVLFAAGFLIKLASDVKDAVVGWAARTFRTFRS